MAVFKKHWVSIFCTPIFSFLQNNFSVKGKIKKENHEI